MPGEKVKAKTENKKAKGDAKDVSKKETKSEKPEKKNKSSKSEKSDKKNRYAGIDKGSAPNVQTKFAGLTFNVKYVQKWMKDYLKRQHSLKDEKTGETVDVKVLNAHFVLGLTDHVICLALANLVADKSKKATANLNVITEESMLSSVRMDSDFSFTFGRFLDKYDKHENYEVQLNLCKEGKDMKTKDVVLNYISEKGFLGGSNSFHFEAGAYNFMMFVMLKNRILLTEAAFQMMQYAKKSSIDDRAVLFASNIVYTGKLGQAIFKKLEELSNHVRGLKSSDAKDNDSTDSVNKDAKKDTKKETKKEVAKKSKDEESEAESESGSGSDSGSESESGSDSD